MGAPSPVACDAPDFELGDLELILARPTFRSVALGPTNWMNRTNDLLALSDWYQAASLSERLAARRELPRDQQQYGELADRKLAKWRTQPPFQSTLLVQRRLAMAGLAEEDLRAYLALDSESVAGLFPTCPAWQSELAAAFSASGESAVAGIPWPQELSGKPGGAGFLRLVEPLIQRARRRLRPELAALSDTDTDLPFDARTVEGLPALAAQLLPMLSRTLTLELKVAGMEKRLEGQTPEQRYLNFIAWLGARETAIGLLRQYPVLARLLTVAVEQWLASELTFLKRVCRDWETIRTKFSGGRAPGTIEELESALSDPHRGGRSVRIARSSSGLRLVYKPNSLAVDRHLQALLGWLNERGLDPLHRQLRVCNRGGHGGVEYAAAEDCRSEPEVPRFYERQGSYLAVLYALSAVAFHCHNLIAAGEEPILVDLEALFHADLGAQDIGGLDQLAGRLLTESLARVGLLPWPAWCHPGADESLDLRGLAAPGRPIGPPAPAAKWMTPGGWLDCRTRAKSC